MSASAALAGFAARTRFDDLPQAVVEHSRRSVVDLLMVARAGSRQPHIVMLLDMLLAEGGGRARVWSGAQRLPLRSATLFNTLSAAALDYDSVIGAAHADLVIWPPLLAIASTRPVDGRTLIAAHATGTEIIARLSAAAAPPGVGWSPTAIYGPYGSAAASARLLGLDAGAVRQALGIALAQSAGTQQGHIEQVLSKNAQPAFAAQAGLLAAQLVASGFTGPAEAIEGRFGSGAVYQPLDEQTLLDGLGQRWLILDTGFKKYPVCACSHPLIETAIDLAERHDLDAKAIAAIEVEVPPLVGRLVGAPFAPGSNPLVTAQFSLAYGLASAFIRRALTLDHLAADQVSDPAIAALAAKIRIRIDDRRSGTNGPSDLHILLATGERIAARATLFPGGPERPLTAAERTAKYRDCAPSRTDLATLQGWADNLASFDDVDAAWPL